MKKYDGPWTQFMDMHSGGGIKEEPFEYIYIQANASDAKKIFYSKFRHNPERVTCTCCGDDYSIKESKDLYQATGFERGCAYDGKKYVEKKGVNSFKDYVTIKDYLKLKTIKLIFKNEIKDSDLDVDVPEQGYVWND